MAKFKIGDLVMIRSGGPRMTVVDPEQRMTSPECPEEIRNQPPTVVCRFYCVMHGMTYYNEHEDTLVLVE